MCVSGRSFQCFRGWGTYVAIAVPSCVMVCMEWWSVECLIILAGLLPDASLSVAVTGICLNIMGLIYMMSFGLSGGHALSPCRLRDRCLHEIPGMCRVDICSPWRVVRPAMQLNRQPGLLWSLLS